MNKDISQALKDILQAGLSGNQEDICTELEAQGFEVNQSKVSRLLRKLGAAKTKNEYGELVYRLPKEPAPQLQISHVHDLVLGIDANEQLIIIRTSPGSASLIARILDYQQESCLVIGTIAGDDTILVVPKSVQQIQQTVSKIRDLLQI